MENSPSAFKEEWVAFVFRLARKQELIIAGEQRIHRNVRWSMDAEVLFDQSFTLADTGYSEAKLAMLQRNYHNPQSVERAKADVRARIQTGKYGSGAFDFRGQPKKATKQDYCIQSCVISYYPQKKGTTIQVFWRTAEAIKRLRGDLLFLRDFILAQFEAELRDAPPFRVDFVFANLSVHPMFTPLIVPHCNWRHHFERVRQDNPALWRAIVYWAWRYLIEPDRSIDSYSAARQVRRIVRRTTDTDTLAEFRRYVESAIKTRLTSFPARVQGFYKRARAA